MANRQVENIVNPPPPHMVGDGFRVHNFIPQGTGGKMDGMDPFILLDYNSRISFPPREHPRGVGVHPHRGFETVTIAYHGRIAHHDSFGNSGVVREGGVQWMTAASGLLHKEYHEENFSRTGGDFQMVQLWVNLPRALKMSPPKYQGLEPEDIPSHTLPDGNGHIEVIAGEYAGTRGAATTFSPIHLMNARLKKGGSATFHFPAHFNTALLVIEGKITVNDSRVVSQDQFVKFDHTGEAFLIRAAEDAVVLVLSGEPIREPIVAYGPFVMNTKEEISQALEDVGKGKFGVLED